jgi:hypothetical protein
LTLPGEYSRPSHASYPSGPVAEHLPLVCTKIGADNAILRNSLIQKP